MYSHVLRKKSDLQGARMQTECQDRPPPPPPLLPPFQVQLNGQERQVIQACTLPWLGRGWMWINAQDDFHGSLRRRDDWPSATFWKSRVLAQTGYLGVRVNPKPYCRDPSGRPGPLEYSGMFDTPSNMTDTSP
jgi:hypothetical protein